MIVALMTVGIMAFAIGAVLLAVREFNRLGNDKVAYEEAYHAALGGVTAAKAWIMNPALAKAQLGNEIGTKIEGITSGALSFSNYVRNNRDNASLLAGLSSSQIVPYYTAFVPSLGGSTLPGDRAVLLSIPASGRSNVVTYPNDAEATMTASLFGGSGGRATVQRIRITTPFRSSGTTTNGDLYTADDVRKVTLVIEAESEVRGAGRPKRRVIQQKILMVPGLPDSPAPISGTDASLIAGAAITPQGTSSLNINWAPAMSKGPIYLLGIGQVASTTRNGVTTWNLEPAGNKFRGAGVNSGNGTENWLRWLTASTLFTQTGSNQVPVFANVPGGSAVVNDFFVQVKSNAFAIGPRANNMNLGGDYVPSLRNTAWVNTGGNVLWSSDPATNSLVPGSGALVQNFPQVNVWVDAIFQQMNYVTWKAFAIANNGYIREGSGGYVNENGSPLYVTPNRTLTTVPGAGNVRLTNIKQISMKPLVPTSGPNAFNTHGIPDRVLFIDTREGTANGTPVNVSLNSSDDFFWKGLLYINGNFSTSGGGAFPTVWMKNPDQYRQDPTGKTTGQAIANCYLDGILFLTGNMSRTGNATVYGSVICKGGYGGSGSPDIYYNTRLREGLFRDVRGTGQTGVMVACVSGPIQEKNAW
jgi:hypothetical protein